MSGLVYKVCPYDAWRAAAGTGQYLGSDDDARDGFIHLSAGEQLAGTLARHFSGQPDLVLVHLDADRLGDALRWEPSRGGALFPHLYGPLPVTAAQRVELLALGEDGTFQLPPEIAPPDGASGSAALMAAGWSKRHTTPGRFVDLVGPIWSRGDGDDFVQALLVEERHLNVYGVMHGGMVMTFADQALGTASWRANGNARQVTVQLDTHFISGPAAGELLEARCRVVRQTQSLMFMAGDLSVGDRPVANVQGIWKVRRKPAEGEAAVGRPSVT